MPIRTCSYHMGLPGVRMVVDRADQRRLGADDRAGLLDELRRRGTARLGGTVVIGRHQQSQGDHLGLRARGKPAVRARAPLPAPVIGGTLSIPRSRPARLVGWPVPGRTQPPTPGPRSAHTRSHSAACLCRASAGNLSAHVAATPVRPRLPSACSANASSCTCVTGITKFAAESLPASAIRARALV